MHPLLRTRACLVSLLGLFFLSSSAVRAELLVLSAAQYTTSWFVDIDDDGVFDIRRGSSGPVMYPDFTDYLNNITSHFVFTDHAGNATSYQNATIFDGTFTAASDTDIFIGNLPTTMHTDHAYLIHGTNSSNLLDQVSLVGFLIESPTTGGNLGWFSSHNHNDDYYIYYHDFGPVSAGQSITINYTASLSSVPEPSTYAALFGMVALGFTAWRRHPRRTCSTR